MKNRFLLGVALSGLLAVTAACGSDSGDANAEGSNGDSGNGSATADGCTPETAGGSLTIAVPATSRTLDPFNGGGNTLEQGGTELQAIYDKLVRFDTESGEFVPHMAESLEANDDNSVWTLTLRDGITFGNGDPVDAAAVKASMDRHLDPEGGSALVANAEQIAAVEAVDELTVEFTLTEPWGTFPSLLAGAFGMVQNVAVIDAMGQEAFASDPAGAGAGPFEVASYSPGQSLSLESKDDYWGGDVCLDQVTFNVIQPNRTAYDSLTNGEVDAMVLGRDPELIAEARDSSDGFNSYGATQIGGDLLLINSGADGADVPGADVRIRQAVAAAIDPEVVNQRAYSGTAKMSSGIIPEGSSFFEPTSGPTYDPDKAAALVEEVKAEGEWDGSIDLDCNSSPQTSEACIAIKALLDSVGFDVNLSTQHSLTEMSTLVRVDKNFELAMWGLSAHEENLWATLKQYYAEAANNAGNFASSDMDAALDLLREAASVDESNEAMEALQAVWTEEVPGLPLTAFEPNLLWRDGVEGVYFTTNVVAFLDKAYIAG